nr:AAA family ATPase [Halomonas elongata]
MKILALRLANLASLPGPLELDFTAEPLASAGLFAITGPTGAGKSTLLDALCLALYGNTPRLRQAPNRDSQVDDPSGQALTTSDPRTLLRRAPPAAMPRSTSSAATVTATVPAGGASRPRQGRRPPAERRSVAARSRR